MRNAIQAAIRSIHAFTAGELAGDTASGSSPAPSPTPAEDPGQYPPDDQDDDDRPQASAARVRTVVAGPYAAMPRKIGIVGIHALPGLNISSSTFAGDSYARRLCYHLKRSLGN